MHYSRSFSDLLTYDVKQLSQHYLHSPFEKHSLCSDWLVKTAKIRKITPRRFFVTILTPWKFCTWKCHTVHIDVHVYFFAVNLVLVGLSEIFSSVFEAIKKLPVSNCSKTYAELYLKELARALFADTYWNVFLNSLGPYVQMCCFFVIFYFDNVFKSSFFSHFFVVVYTQDFFLMFESK